MECPLYARHEPGVGRFLLQHVHPPHAAPEPTRAMHAGQGRGGQTSLAFHEKVARRIKHAEHE
jgi:hypothetical protein